MTAHVELPDRTALVLQMFYAEAIEHWSDSGDLTRQLTPLRHLFDAAADAAVNMGAASRLDDVLASCVTRAITEIRGIPVAERGPLEQAADLLDRLVAHHNCNTCATAASTTHCSKGSEDALVRALCLDWLQLKARTIHSYVRDRYHSVAESIGIALPDIAVEISTYRLNDDEFGFGLMAETSPSSEVSISLAIDGKSDPPVRFKAEGYFALDYVLFHEIASHVYFGLLVTPVPRTLGPDDAFCEGWMDHVAFELLSDWNDTTPAQTVCSLLGSGDRAPLGYEQRRMSSARDFRTVRLGKNREGRGATRMREARRHGELLWAQWSSIVKQIHAGDARSLVLDSSLALNLLGFSEGSDHGSVKTKLLASTWNKNLRAAIVTAISKPLISKNYVAMGYALSMI